jgi:5-methylthioribose kinase
MPLDIEDFDALQLYLRQQGHLRAGQTVSLEKLAGGVSNRTVRVGWPDGHGWVLKQALAKLRVQADWFSDPERIGVEARALRWLQRLAPPGTTPAFVFEDPGNHLLAMEAIPQDHENWKAVLLAGRIIPDHFEQSARLLAAIHLRSSDPGLDVPNAFADTTHFETLRLQPYYIYTAQQVSEAADFLNALACETLQHKVCLVHGDFSPKNILIYQGKLVLLDHEVVHFGEPAFDLGFVLTHFLSKAHHLLEHRARIAAAAALFWEVYQQNLALLPRSNVFHGLEPRTVRHTLACLLARVAGKSPLEYLSPEEKVRQRKVVLELMVDPPAGVPDLIAEFTGKIKAHAEN